MAMSNAESCDRYGLKNEHPSSNLKPILCQKINEYEQSTRESPQGIIMRPLVIIIIIIIIIIVILLFSRLLLNTSVEVLLSSAGTFWFQFACCPTSSRYLLPSESDSLF